MKLDDLGGVLDSKRIAGLFKKTFGYSLEENRITPSITKKLLEELSFHTKKIRRSSNYYISEQKPEYLSCIIAIKFLEQKLLEQNPKKSPTAYKHGITRGIKHGLDTSTKFVPHVAGSAFGAFIGGLKGQALHSEAGRIKIAELEKELVDFDPKNPVSTNKFLSKQIKEHFDEYSLQQKKVIANYIQQLYKDGVAGRNQNAQTIAQQMEKLQNNPFQNTTPENKKKLVTYFMDIYQGGVNAAEANAKPKTASSQTLSKIPQDVVSALKNLGYKERKATEAVTTVLNRNKNLENNFNELFKKSQQVIKK